MRRRYYLLPINNTKGERGEREDERGKRRRRHGRREREERDGGREGAYSTEDGKGRGGLLY